MKKYILPLIVASVVLSGCSITVPAVAKKENGVVFIGQAKASIAEGSIEMYNDETGIECHGTYDQWSTDSLMRVKLNCSDGSFGTANLMRTKDGLNGSGEGYLNHKDGKRERILVAYGDRVLQEHSSPAFWKTIDGDIRGE